MGKLDAVFEYMPEFNSWTGIFFYSLLLYVMSLVVSGFMAPLLAPAIAPAYKE